MFYLPGSLTKCLPYRMCGVWMVIFVLLVVIHVCVFILVVISVYSFCQVHLQNASLAGGVAVGAVADMMIMPWGATLLGVLSGVISTLGITYVTVCKSSDLFKAIHLRGTNLTFTK